MTSRIAYSPNGIGQQVSDFVNDVQTVLAKGRRLQKKLDSMSSGNDWPAVEAEVGGMVAGTGQTLWTIIATAMGQIDSPQVAELSRLDKQG
jgi:hypothetical protein